MRRILLIVTIAAVLTSCKKDEGPSHSGTITIDNWLTLVNNSYYSGNGFSVPTGKKLSYNANPPANMIILIRPINQDKILLSSVNYLDSFFRYGEYNSSTSASEAFTNLTAFTATGWTEPADSIKPNQIWIFRTSDEKYAKIRIIDTLMRTRENKPYAECTFEWVFQPDGTQLFPGK